MGPWSTPEDDALIPTGNLSPGGLDAKYFLASRVVERLVCGSGIIYSQDSTEQAYKDCVNMNLGDRSSSCIFRSIRPEPYSPRIGTRDPTAFFSPTRSMIFRGYIKQQ